MKSRWLIVPALLPVLSLCLACRTPRVGVSVPPPPGADPPNRPVRLTIVGTNDFHGHVSPNRMVLRDGTTVEMGGSAILAGYLANLRAENPGGVILLDGGDLFQGTIASNVTEGAVVVDVYNYLGYTAAAIGNHEFDYGSENFTRLDWCEDLALRLKVFPDAKNRNASFLIQEAYAALGRHLAGDLR